MNGQMREFYYERYFEQIRTMPEPVMISEIQKVKLNLKGIREYAKSRGVAIASLLRPGTVAGNERMVRVNGDLSFGSKSC